MREISGIAGRILALVVALFLAIAYLKLGYFLILLLPLGAWGAVRITRRQRSGFPRTPSTLLTVLGYLAATAAVWGSAVRSSEETWELSWEVVEATDGTSPEIRLGLGGGHYLLSRSAELRDHLDDRGSETVTATLPITRFLGCFQSVGPVRIEGWGTAPSGGYLVKGNSPGPWPEHWWCP